MSAPGHDNSRAGIDTCGHANGDHFGARHDASAATRPTGFGGRLSRALAEFARLGEHHVSTGPTPYAFAATFSAERNRPAQRSSAGARRAAFEPCERHRDLTAPHRLHKRHVHDQADVITI